MKNKYVFILVALAAALLFAAAKSSDLDPIGQIPVLHEGRIKPLDSFARIELRQIAGRESLKGMSANDWLAMALFDPARASALPLIPVQNADLQRQLGLKDRPHGLFSLQDLGSGLARTEKTMPDLARRDPQTLALAQNALLDLHQKAFAYARVMSGVSMILPLETPAGREGETYLALKKNEPAMKSKLAGIIKRKGENIDHYDKNETTLALQGLQIAVLESEARKSNLFKIIPPQWPGQTDWLTPWESMDTGLGSPWSARYILLWQKAARAYRASDQEQRAIAVREILTSLQDKSGQAIPWTKLRTEIAYNHIRPFFRAELLYAAALGLMAMFMRTKRAGLYAAGIGLAGLGIIFHIAGIVLRVYILSRPPVGTLFESLLFVGAVVVLCALAVEFARRDGLSLLCGLAAVLTMMLVTPVFAPAGDAMQMLVAVLNTNFWLATHVIFITTGYGVCVFTALLAHVALYRRAIDSGDRGERQLEKTIPKMLIAGLFLTAVGTALGGIWADQSWGRFWGWDPKENGALLIVLWIVWILHGRLGGFLAMPYYLAAVSFLAVIVALSWFGVNLLSVGLHSYGFTSGMATGLFLYCGIEIVLIALALWKARVENAR